MERGVHLNPMSSVVKIAARQGYGNRNRPAFIHECLLKKRSETLNTLVQEALESNKDSPMIELPLSNDQLRIWSEWLYGIPLYNAGSLIGDCHSAHSRLNGLCDLYAKCAKPGSTMYDLECANACLDAIRDYIINGVNKPSFNPLISTCIPLTWTGDSKGWTMLLDLLVNEKCLAGGNTKRWVGGIGDSEDCGYIHHGFLRDLTARFADKWAKETGDDSNQSESKYNANPMESCAYHERVDASRPCCTTAAASSC